MPNFDITRAVSNLDERPLAEASWDAPVALAADADLAPWSERNALLIYGALGVAVVAMLFLILRGMKSAVPPKPGSGAGDEKAIYHHGMTCIQGTQAVSPDERELRGTLALRSCLCVLAGDLHPWNSRCNSRFRKGKHDMRHGFRPRALRRAVLGGFDLGTTNAAAAPAPLVDAREYLTPSLAPGTAPSSLTCCSCRNPPRQGREAAPGGRGPARQGGGPHGVVQADADP